MPLEKHYIGDKAFARFASTSDKKLDAQLDGWPNKVKLVELCGGDQLLARAVFYAASTDIWLNRRTPETVFAICITLVIH